MKTMLIAVLTGACGLALPVHAEDAATASANREQQAMMAAYERMGEVRPEHRQLAYFVGDWDATTTMWMDPEAPPMTSKGSSRSAAILGGRYIETLHEGEAMGQPFSGRGLIGFDNLDGRYFNTWIDSMSTGFWLARGTYDAATTTYTFRGTTDDPMQAGTKTPVRIALHVVDPTHYRFEWYETHAGKEAKTMQIDYVKR